MHSYEEQGLAAKIEKILFDTYAIEPKHLAPHGSNGVFGLRLSRHKILVLPFRLRVPALVNADGQHFLQINDTPFQSAIEMFEQFRKVSPPSLDSGTDEHVRVVHQRQLHSGVRLHEEQKRIVRMDRADEIRNLNPLAKRFGGIVDQIILKND